MVNTSEFAKRLQKILNYYGLSATAFSEEIEFNRSTISHLLSGRNKPSLEFVMKVLQKFPEVKLHWLLNGKGNFPAVEKPDFPPTQIVSPAEQPNLFQGESNQVLKKDTLHSQKTVSDDSISEIERIVIFYKDGKFKEYKNL